MVQLLRDIVEYYLSVEFFHNLNADSYDAHRICLTPDYPHYDIGIRCVESKKDNYTVHVDLDFFNHLDLNSLKPNSYYKYLTFRVISNDLNLECMVINLSRNINKFIELFFDIDMHTHYLDIGSYNYDFIDDCYLNWSISGINILNV